jgi:hypothetical protein
MIRIAVTGGRDYADEAAVFKVLDRVRELHGQFVLVHGAARGADALADKWARARGVDVERHPADWTKGRSAGPARNATMASSGLDLLVAFPGGRGTADMVQRCRNRGVGVVYARMLEGS